MGQLFTIVCENHKCLYHAKLRQGPGMLSFARAMDFRDAVVNGEIDNVYAKSLFDTGAEIRTNGIYLCPHCKEFQTNEIYYVADNLEDGPNDEILYDAVFPFGEPRCSKCHAEMTLIKDILAPDVKCPKCGSTLRPESIGFFD